MTGNTQVAKPILVLNGTGKVGRRVVQRLRARGVPTQVGSRSAWLDALPGAAEKTGDFADFARDVAASGVWDAAPMSIRPSKRSSA